jgi:hypothetical protein
MISFLPVMLFGLGMDYNVFLRIHEAPKTPEATLADTLPKNGKPQPNSRSGAYRRSARILRSRRLHRARWVRDTGQRTSSIAERVACES